jgi:hypothetical protein
MSAFIARLKNEPAVVIGIIGAAAVAAIQSLAGNEIIRPDIAATIGNLVGTLEQPGPIVLILAGIVTRFFVFGPTTAATLRDSLPPGVNP